MTGIVELKGVGKEYNGSAQPALENLTLSFAAGEITAILGPSGSGKSTLLNLIAGLDRPTKGSILVDGIAIERLGEAALARYRRTKVGLIFQFFNLLNTMTVLDNIALPAQLAGASRKAAQAHATELIERLGIADEERKYPSQLSGGQRQRVAVGRALINRPPLLLADEPTGALDTRSGESVIDMLLDLNRGGQTILLVTHDERLAERCAGRIITLVDGRLEPHRPVLGVAR